MSTRKNLADAPRVDDITTAMRGRYDTHPDTANDPPSARTPSPTPTKTRRSWLLPTDVAEALAAAAARIHHQSGGTVSKSDAQAALIRAGLDHETDIATDLASANHDSPHS